jgi:hypothetical protein
MRVSTYGVKSRSGRFGRGRAGGEEGIEDAIEDTAVAAEAIGFEDIATVTSAATVALNKALLVMASS